MKKVKFLFFPILIGVLLLCLKITTAANNSPDAIAIRIIPNLKHYSVLRWYQEQQFNGSPQSLLVDGYEAVRDGRTVYINVANVEDLNNNDILDTNDRVFTNVFVISYNQDAENSTVDIFGQLLANWKFNTNINTAGRCKAVSSTPCLNSNECSAADYCGSSKSVITREVKRLADLADINQSLDAYKNKHDGLCPKISSGSYLTNKTISTWPSWQSALGTELGASLPVDPINKLGRCKSDAKENQKYDSKSCWNETDKKFAGTVDPVFSLPVDSLAYMYISSSDGRSCRVFSVMESGLVCDNQGLCTVSNSLSGSNLLGASLDDVSNSKINQAPKINGSNLPLAGQNLPYEGFFTADDPDGDRLSWNISTSGDWSSWTMPVLKDTGIKNQKKFYSPKAGLIKDYNFTVTVTDNYGSTTSGNYKVQVVNRCIDKDEDGYGVCPNCGVARGCKFDGNDCDDVAAEHSVYSNYLKHNTNVYGKEIHPNQKDDCSGYLGVDDNCSGVEDEDMTVANTALGGIQDMETINAVSGLPFGMSGHEATYSSISVSKAENHTSGGGNSLLLHKDASRLGLICSEAMCAQQGCAFINNRCYYISKDTGHNGSHQFTSPEKTFNGIEYYSDYDAGENIGWPNLANSTWAMFSYNVSGVNFQVGDKYFLLYFYKGSSNSKLNQHSGIVYNLPSQVQPQQNDYYRPCGSPGVNSYWGSFSGYLNSSYQNAAGKFCRDYCQTTSVLDGITYCNNTDPVDGISLANKSPECGCYIQRNNPYLTSTQQATPYEWKRFSDLNAVSGSTAWSMYQDNLTWTPGMNSTLDYSGNRSTSLFFVSNYNDTGIGTDLYIDDLSFVKCTNK